MIVSYTSCADVIGRVIRNTRLQDTSYILDMPEWIGEAMGQMRTKVVLQTRHIDILVQFHKGQLPMGVVDITAVEYNGMRLEYGDDVRDIATHHGHPRNSEIGTNTFVSVPLIAETPEGDKFYDSTALPLCTNGVDECNNLSCDTGNFYNTELGYINTSMKTAWIRVHYTRVPLDDQEKPLIPDHEDYKTALYYYIRKQMIGTGYDDKVFKYMQLEELFAIHARRAINDISYPSVEQMEVRRNTLNRLVTNESWFDEFFSTTHGEKQYGDMYTAITPWHTLK